MMMMMMMTMMMMMAGTEDNHEQNVQPKQTQTDKHTDLTTNNEPMKT